MGGFGSGRRSGCGRPVVEDGLALDLACLVRGHRRQGVLTWTWGQGGKASIGYRLDLDAERLTLNFTTGSDRRPIEQSIRLTATYPHFGGRRWWMTCPETGKRCGKLYSNAGSDLFLSREALGLAYRSQREDEMDRALRRAFKVLDRLGGGNDLDEIHYLPKPKWMRWKTFNREMMKAREANSMNWSCAFDRFGGLAERF
jgi:hypothetical protein